MVTGNLRRALTSLAAFIVDIPRRLLAFLRRAYTSFTVHVFDIPPRLLALLLLLLFLGLPLTGLDIYTLGIFITANVFAIFAVSWDLLVGRTGQISLGHALFFGVGAYASALLFKYFSLPLWFTIPMALLAGFSVALLVGFPCLKVKGPYLALVTMAFPIILSAVIYSFAPVTGGEQGIINLPTFFPFPNYFLRKLAEYYFTLILLAASAMIVYKIANSKTGIVFVSILDNELASKASGINVTRYKLLAFAISGLFGSLAGAVYAHLLTIANPPTLLLTISFLPVILTILGGLGTIYGPIVGAYIYYILNNYVFERVITIPSLWQVIIVNDFVQIRFPIHTEYLMLLVFTAVVVLLVIIRPRGIARLVVDKLKDLEEARDIEERARKRQLNIRRSADKLKAAFERSKKEPEPATKG